MNENELDNEKKAALIRPHAVNLADTIVDIRVDSKEGLCSVTFGLRNQIGGLDPATTVFMPFSAFKSLQEELAKKLQALD